MSSMMRRRRVPHGMQRRSTCGDVQQTWIVHFRPSMRRKEVGSDESAVMMIVRRHSSSVIPATDSDPAYRSGLISKFSSSHPQARMRMSRLNAHSYPRGGHRVALRVAHDAEL